MANFFLVLDQISEHQFAQVNEVVDRSSGALSYIAQGRTGYPVISQPTSNSGFPTAYHSVRIEWSSPEGIAAATELLRLFAAPAAATAHA